MKIKMNLNGNFKLCPEGERVLTITKAECKPSGKPDNMKVTFQDSEGGFVNSKYDFTNDKSLFAMGMLVSKVLEIEDGEEFDTKTDTPRLVGKKVLCEIVHTEGTKPNEDGELPVFANIKKVIALVDDETGEVQESEKSARNMIADDEDDDLE